MSEDGTVRISETALRALYELYRIYFYAVALTDPGPLITGHALISYGDTDRLTHACEEIEAVEPEIKVTLRIANRAI